MGTVCVLHSVEGYSVCTAHYREALCVNCKVYSGTLCVLHSVGWLCVCIAQSGEALCTAQCREALSVYFTV